MIGSKITQIADLAQQARQGDNSRLQGAAALKAGYDAYKLASDPSALNVGGINASAKASADKIQPGGASDPANSAFGVSVSLGTSSSSQDSRQSSTQQRGTNLQAQNIDIKATESDINMVGAKLQAQNIALDAAKDVNLIAAQNTAEIQSKNNSSSAGIGVTFGFGEQSGISFQIGASNGKGRADGSETTYDNTQVTATNKLSVKSGNDTSLIGAQLAGKTVEMDVGGKLNIETLQDSSNYASKQTTGGFGLSLCIPPFCYGTTVSGNLSASKQQVDHNYLSAVGQSGIAAGTGGFDIKVAGATDLKGAAITSEADKSKNTLSTSSLTYSDLQNRRDTSASSESASLSFSSGASMASNLASNLTNNLLANAMGNTGLPESGSQSGVTQSVISPAQVTITGGDRQSEENVATLTSRDASTANGSLKNTLTLQQAQELQAQQQKAKGNAQAAQYIGAVITNAIGDLALKNDWPEGSWQKTVLHGMAGVIQAKVAGTSAMSGALAGALNEQLLPIIEAYLKEQGIARYNQDGTPNQEFNTLLIASSTLAGAATGAATGGAGAAGSGAVIANNATVNNRLLHENEKAKIKELAKGNFELEKNLTDVACVIAKCAAGKAAGDPARDQLLAIEQEVFKNTDGKYTEALALLAASQTADLFTYTAFDQRIDAINAGDVRSGHYGLTVPELLKKAQATSACGSSSVCREQVDHQYTRIASDRSEFNIALENIVRSANSCIDLRCSQDALKELSLYRQDIAYQYHACQDDACRAGTRYAALPLFTAITSLKGKTNDPRFLVDVATLLAMGLGENAQNGAALITTPGAVLPTRGNGRGITNGANSGEPRVFASNDPMVGQTATTIDRLLPGAVKDVNVPIKNPGIGMSSDADILLKNGDVIEVKSGGGKGATTQVANQTKIIGDSGEVIVYGPDLKPSVVKGIQGLGTKVFRNLDDLLAYIRSKGL